MKAALFLALALAPAAMQVGDGGPLIGIGFDATNGYSTFSLGYEGEFSDQIERHSLNAAIRFRF